MNNEKASPEKELKLWLWLLLSRQKEKQTFSIVFPPSFSPFSFAETKGEKVYLLPSIHLSPDASVERYFPARHFALFQKRQLYINMEVYFVKTWTVKWLNTLLNAVMKERWWKQVLQLPSCHHRSSFHWKFN